MERERIRLKKRRKEQRQQSKWCIMIGLMMTGMAVVLEVIGEACGVMVVDEGANGQ